MNVSKIIPKTITVSKSNLPAINYNFDKLILPSSSIKIVDERPVSEVCARALKSLMQSEMIVSKTYVTDRLTKEKNFMYITKFEQENKKYLYIKDKEAKKVGYMVLEKPQRGMFSFPMGDDYIYNSMEATSLETINKGNNLSRYRGLGTELLKAAVKESKKSGYGGRIHLMAYNSHPPTPFYFKCGFRFVDEEKNKLMQEYIDNQTRGIQTDLIESIKQGLMYLPDENINSLLAK